MLCKNGDHELQLYKIRSRSEPIQGRDTHYDAECIECGARYWQHARGFPLFSTWKRSGAGDDCRCS